MSIVKSDRKDDTQKNKYLNICHRFNPSNYSVANEGNTSE